MYQFHGRSSTPGKMQGVACHGADSGIPGCDDELVY
jgi:hypothetical protein